MKSSPRLPMIIPSPQNAREYPQTNHTIPSMPMHTRDWAMREVMLCLRSIPP